MDIQTAQQETAYEDRGLISWSYSALKDYETCPHRIKLKLDKAPVPEQEENRGTIIHRLAEQYVKGEIEELPRELRKFETQFEEDRNAFFEGKLEVESEWGFTYEWEPCSWFDAYCRIKCDQVLHISDSEARVTDHKTGKRWGNEVGHMDQAALYALGTFMRYPKVDAIETEFRYLDVGEQTKRLWSRDKDCIRLMQRYEKRVQWLQMDKTFKPKPTRMACHWCRYSNNEVGSGACGYSVPWGER